ncbi:MAG: trypsin-like peptidase domain-containing protein [Planctomycetota bacterium]|jgi:serine protease Do
MRVSCVAYRFVIAAILLSGFACTSHTARDRLSTESADIEEPLSRLDFRKVVADAKNKVFPAVVFIKSLKESYESGKKISQETAGSGVIVSPDGWLLTNRHVVDKATEVRCLLTGGEKYDAEIVGTDKDTDLALLKLKLPADVQSVPYASLGDSSKLKEGDFVMAMGAPWGLSRSVSIGIVSCVRRFLPDSSEYSLWLQTDAAISPGNSGGPLVNTDGQVVGITTLGITFGGDMGFAIPAATVRQVVEQLRDYGKMNWSWTGLQLQPLRDFNRNVYFDAEEGVIVSETDLSSPARRAGLLARDRIVRIDNAPVTAATEEDLPGVRVRLGLLEKDKPVKVDFYREGEAMSVSIIPREKGRVEGEELDCPRWDLTVKVINQFDNPDLYFYRKEGVFIYGIKYPGNASNAKLQRNDILLRIDGKEITTLDDVKVIHAEAIENIQTKHKLLLSVLRNGLMRQVVLDFARDYEKE